MKKKRKQYTIIDQITNCKTNLHTNKLCTRGNNRLKTTLKKKDKKNQQSQNQLNYSNKKNSRLNQHKKIKTSILPKFKS